MKIFNLTRHSRMYTCNVYLILGTWNAIGDMNTLVDVGRDPSIVEKIREASTGVGKKKVEQVVLTHSHYDHSGMLSVIHKAFNPTVYAFSPSLKGIGRLLHDGDELTLGDRVFEVIHTPGHSHDSICLYCEAEGILFAGDSSVVIQSGDGTYEGVFVEALKKISRRDIRSIYFGHGNPLLEKFNTMIRNSLKNLMLRDVR